MSTPAPTSLLVLAAVTVSLGAAAASSVAVAVAVGRPAAILAPPAAPADDPTGPRGFTARGTATIEAVPDVAELLAVVEVERPRPRDAARLARERTDALIAALGAAGVGPADVALSTVVLDEVRETVDRERGTTRLRGHRAAVRVTIATRDFDRVAELMELAAGAGASAVSSQFRVEDLPALKQRLRTMAAEAARDKARTLASALGVDLGDVRAIAESPGDGWSWGGTYANAVVREAPAADAGHGTLQSLTLTVDVTYDLSPGA